MATKLDTKKTDAKPLNDPFAAQRDASSNPFAAQRESGTIGNMATSDPPDEEMPRDRRMSKEWDASKVPPSRFQKREGSIYATPGSRDAHVGKGQDRDKGFHDKLKEKGWVK